LDYPGVSEWQPGEWHHVAASWSFQDKGKAEVALYIDGKLVGIQKNLTIEMDDAAWNSWAAQTTALPKVELMKRNVCFGAVWGRQYAACLDDLRIFDHVRHYEQILPPGLPIGDEHATNKATASLWNEAASGRTFSCNGLGNASGWRGKPSDGEFLIRGRTVGIRSCPLRLSPELAEVCLPGSVRRNRSARTL